MPSKYLLHHELRCDGYRLAAIDLGDGWEPATTGASADQATRLLFSSPLGDIEVHASAAGITSWSASTLRAEIDAIAAEHRANAKNHV